MKSFVIDMYRFRGRLLASLIGLIASCLVVVSASGATEPTIAEAAKFLPDKIESLQASGPAALPIDGISKRATLTDFAVISNASRSYHDDAGHIFTLEVARTENDSSAYALLTRLALGVGEIKTDTVGIASVLSSSRIVFCKGNSLVQIESSQGEPGDRDRSEEHTSELQSQSNLV